MFLLTGFWHGASWTFVVWGLFHGFFMLLERIGLDKWLEKVYSPIAQAYTLLVVMLAWVLFRANNFDHAMSYWKALFLFEQSPNQILIFVKYLNKEFLIVLFLALAGSFGWLRPLLLFKQKLVQGQSILIRVSAMFWMLLEWLFYGGILLLSTLYLAAGTYNPFIYYRF